MTEIPGSEVPAEPEPRGTEQPATGQPGIGSDTPSPSPDLRPPSPAPSTGTGFPAVGIRTRDEVLRAVISLIAEHGVDGMTMRQVARATGLSTGTINYHFTNKRTLILAALEAAPAAPSPGDGGSPLERLGALLRGFVLDDIERRAWWRFWVEVTAQAARDPELRERQRARLARQRQEVEELLRQPGLESGGTDSPESRSEPLLALAYGLAVQQLIAADEATVARASAALDGALRDLAPPL